MGVRPIQIAKTLNFITQIYFVDPWGSPTFETYQNWFGKYVEDSTIFSINRNWQIINHYEINKAYLEKADIFLDLTYHRHELLKDLENMHAQQAKDSFISGNMFDDPYVQEILERFSKAAHAEVNNREMFGTSPNKGAISMNNNKCIHFFLMVLSYFKVLLCFQFLSKSLKVFFQMRIRIDAICHIHLITPSLTDMTFRSIW